MPKIKIKPIWNGKQYPSCRVLAVKLGVREETVRTRHKRGITSDAELIAFREATRVTSVLKVDALAARIDELQERVRAIESQLQAVCPPERK